MCFLRNRSSYSFETCTIVIGMPENLRVCRVWPTKYKGKWCFNPKCVFSETGSSYSFETCTIVIGMPENLRVCRVWPSKYKGKWCFSPKCVFSEMRSSYSFETCTIALSMPENLRVCRVWPSKYKGKWCFSPKCVFSEMDHHTDLKPVPLDWAHLKTSGYTEFGPLNTKESDVLAQNVFSQKQIIIQLWNLSHCDWHASNLRVFSVWTA